MIRIFHKGEMIETTEGNWQADADAMLQKLGGPWDASQGSRIERTDDAMPTDDDAPEATAKANSTWTAQVTDESAKERIEATHKALGEAGITVNVSEQLYATGTRMADVGYSTQATRAKEHAEKQSLKDCADQLRAMVESERRRDIVVTAGDFAAQLSIEKGLTFDGLKVREQTIRGLLTRIESPALRYVLGLRDRIAETAGELAMAKGNPNADVNREQLAAFIAKDKAELLQTLKHECARFADVELKLRARDGLGDVFAAVSPSYAPADAPSVLGDIIAQLPTDTKATFAYDPMSTSWELRAAVFTSTPVDEQAVGEAFEAFASFRSKDNGTGTYRNGGGILLLRCLNASVYEALTRLYGRRHVGKILQDVAVMVKDASSAMHILCDAWGTARKDTIARPNDDTGKLIPLEVAIPGFFRSMLTARKGELVGVLPGRTEAHVKQLAAIYPSEQRNAASLNRADFAQAYTRYIQTQPSDVRRDAEAAIGKWLVTPEPMQYVAA